MAFDRIWNVSTSFGAWRVVAVAGVPLCLDMASGGPVIVMRSVDQGALVTYETAVIQSGAPLPDGEVAWIYAGSARQGPGAPLWHAFLRAAQP